MFLVGLTIYTRYRQILHLTEKHEDLQGRADKMNWRSVWIGFGSCLGISIVANFQETNVRIVHYIGALLCFGLGTVYFWMQV
jgi:DNA damage-regulated autophagy modulator protein 2